MKLFFEFNRIFSVLFTSLLAGSSVAYGSTDFYEAPESHSEVAVSRLPSYQTALPEWGVQFSASANALGGGSNQALTHDQKSNPAYGFSLLSEYQPRFIQKFGVLGIGPALEVFTIRSGANTDGPFSMWSAGGQIRYQARYFREQPIVPVVAYTAEYFNYRFIQGGSGSLFASGPTFGLWILLNILDTNSASQFYTNVGILRSYLVLEYKNLNGSDNNIRFSGGSYYAGVRCEF
jgi:hypothetical protein